MSDHSKVAECSDVLRSSEIRRPGDPLRKIVHWKHINSVKSPRVHRELDDDADVYKEECARGRQSLPAQFWKSKAIGIGNKKADHGSSPVMSDALHTVDGMITGKGAINGTEDCPRKENTRAFESERMIFSKTSVCGMESSCVDWKNIDLSPFLQRGIVSSEWQRHAELKIKQRRRDIVGSKRKFSCWDSRLDRGQLQTTQPELSSSPDEVKCMPGNIMFQGGYMVQSSRLYRFFEKKRLPHSGSSRNHHVGSTSGYGLGGISRMPGTGPSIFTIEENIHSVSGISCKQKLTDHNCLNVENEILDSFNHSLPTFLRKKSNERRIMEHSRPTPRNHSPKADGDSTTGVSDGDLLLVKRSNMHGFIELNEFQQQFQQTVPSFSTCEVRKCANIDSVGRPLEISDTYEKDGGQSVDAYSTELENESHIRAACLNIGAQTMKSLPEGGASAKSDKKDFTCIENPRKSKLGSDLQMKEAIISNQETDLLDTTLDFSPCIGTAKVDAKGLCTSRTDTMEIEHIILDAGKPEKSGYNQKLEDHVGTYMSSRWVKRLKVNSDSVAIGTSDSRDYSMEDILTTRRVHKLFSKVLNYSRSNSFTLAKCLQERQQFQKTMLLLRNGDSPVESLKESQPWIQRWCQRSEESAHPKTRKPIEVLCEPEKTKPLPESLEGKLFPSLAAMALMGKAINNFRPCEFRRRGSSLVWNTEGF